MGTTSLKCCVPQDIFQEKAPLIGNDTDTTYTPSTTVSDAVYTHLLSTLTPTQKLNSPSLIQLHQGPLMKILIMNQV